MSMLSDFTTSVTPIGDTEYPWEIPHPPALTGGPDIKVTATGNATLMVTPFPPIAVQVTTTLYVSLEALTYYLVLLLPITGFG